MCGRYVILTKVKKVSEVIRADIRDRTTENFPVRSNLSVGQVGLIVIKEEGVRRLMTSAFGLSPSWSEKRRYLFNARAEGDRNRTNDPDYRGMMGIKDKPSFRTAIRQRRCLIPADAFIEGPELAKLNEPYLIFRPNISEPFFFAGIYEDWVDRSSGEIFRGFAIITTMANSLTQRIGHPRAPLVLEEAWHDAWLDSSTELATVSSMMGRWDSKDWNAYPLDPSIKSPKNLDITHLSPIGPCLKADEHWHTEHILKLYGMGENPSRERRQGRLFD